jgi:hypothetical protein
VPDDDVLESAYRRAYERAQINKAIERAAEQAEQLELPDDLRSQVRDGLGKSPRLRWDDVIVDRIERLVEDE